MNYFDFQSTWEIYFSLILSLLSIYGFKEIGGLITSCCNLFSKNNSQALWAFDVVVGSILVAIIFEYSLFLQVNSNNARLLAYTIPLIAVFRILLRLPKLNPANYFNWKAVRFDLENYVKVILGLYFILCLAPITNADALDYHIGVPQTFMVNNELIWPIEWFHFGLLGLGEYLIYYSMLLEAEQLSTLIQFFSLLSIIQLIRLGVSTQNNDFNVFLTCLVVTTPVLLFLISSPKPQLIGISLSTHLIYIVTTKKLSHFTKKQALLFFALLITIPCIKLNFLFSVIAIMLFFVISNWRFLLKNYLVTASIPFAILIILLLIFGPVIIAKFRYHGILDIGLLYPVSSNYDGSSEFISYLRNYSDSSFPFPISILLPSSFGKISMILGVNVLIVLWIISKSQFTRLYLPILFLISISIIAGQKTARFFLEPYIWTLVGLSLSKSIHLSNKPKDILKILALFKIIVVSYGVFTLSRGILNLEQRKSVLENTAYGYRVSEWVNSILDDNTKVLLGHRSMSLFNQKTFSSDWTKYVPHSASQYYVEHLKRQSIDYVVIVAADPKNSPLIRYCGPLAYGPFHYKSATRNPFNSGTNKTAWIFKASL